MARPRRRGLDYFPMDVDMFQDIKIRKLQKMRGGIGTALYFSLLCSIYKSGYYIRWNDDMAFCFAESSGIIEEDICNIVEDCVRIGLFDESLWRSERILTSYSIQERFAYICKQLKRSSSVEEFRLIPMDLFGCESESAGDGNSAELEQENVSSVETPVSSGEMPQRKRKEKKLKTSTPNVVDGKSEKPTQSDSDSNSKQFITYQIGILKSEKTWLQGLCKEYDLHSTSIESLLDKFSEHCIDRGKSIHPKGLIDVKRHFKNWINSGGPFYGTKQKGKKGVGKKPEAKAMAESRLQSRPHRLTPQMVIRSAGYDPDKVRMCHFINPNWRAANPPEYKPVPIERLMAQYAV